MVTNAHRPCKKGTSHWCFVYHCGPDDRVAAYHEKCSIESPPLMILNQPNILMQFWHPPWHTLCTAALTNRQARLNVFPLSYLCLSNVLIANQLTPLSSSTQRCQCACNIWLLHCSKVSSILSRRYDTRHLNSIAQAYYELNISQLCHGLCCTSVRELLTPTA